MMHSIRIALALALGAALFSLPTPGTVVAQDQAARHCPGKLEALNASYHQQLRDIECRWIAELADLADKSSGPDATDAYRQLFNVAIARDLCIEAQPAARNCLESIPAAPDIPALAASVQVFARADEEGVAVPGDPEVAAALLLGFLNEAAALVAAAPEDRALRVRVGDTVDAFIARLFG